MRLKVHYERADGEGHTIEADGLVFCTCLMVTDDEDVSLRGIESDNISTEVTIRLDESE